MMGLGPALGRQRAHDLVYDICREVIATGRPLPRPARRERRRSRRTWARGAGAAVDPANYLGLCGEMVDRVLDREPRP